MEFDAAIVGGALVGSGFAAALRASRLRLALIEAHPPAAASAEWDPRVYAISPSSARFLQDVGIWSRLDLDRITPVYEMEIHGDGGARLDFSAYDSGVDELAWIVEGGLIQRELWETVKRQPNLETLCPARPAALAFDARGATLGLEDGRSIRARLIVAADGVESWVRKQAGIEASVTGYGESGVVANFECEQPHRNRAYQWFRPDGVLAYLPLPGNRVSIVWSAPDALAGELVALPAEALCERVAAAAGHRLGGLRRITPARAFPLRMMRVTTTVAPRLALVGDAAHAIHPLSGHGVNLGFQDARVLAERIDALSPGRDCGELGVLRGYARARAEEVLALQAVTHGLQRLFRPQWPWLAALRNAGMNLTNSLPVVRNMLVRYALG
jgi:ubiquinone biosynthesis UbiH/UbiF/VisC/COQ6 family hydroxylase